MKHMTLHLKTNIRGKNGRGQGNVSFTPNGKIFGILRRGLKLTLMFCMSFNPNTAMKNENGFPQMSFYGTLEKRQ